MVFGAVFPLVFGCFLIDLKGEGRANTGFLLCEMVSVGLKLVRCDPILVGYSRIKRTHCAARILIKIIAALGKFNERSRFVILSVKGEPRTTYYSPSSIK